MKSKTSKNHFKLDAQKEYHFKIMKNVNNQRLILQGHQIKGVLLTFPSVCKLCFPLLEIRWPQIEAGETARSVMDSFIQKKRGGHSN